jgi:hypothetical protein
MIDETSEGEDARQSRDGGRREERDVPQVPFLRSVDDEVFVDSEEVGTTDSLSLVGFLTTICDLLSNQLADVLDDHLSSRDESTPHNVSDSSTARGERMRLTPWRTIRIPRFQTSRT